MPIFAYRVITTVSQAEGTIEAENQAIAKQQLVDTYGFDAYDGVQHFDENGDPIEHKVLTVELTEDILPIRAPDAPLPEQELDLIQSTPTDEQPPAITGSSDNVSVI